MALEDNQESSLVEEDPGELVYLKCSCCDLLVEHHCKADKAQIPDNGAVALTTPMRGKGKRRQSKKGGFTKKKKYSTDALLASTSGADDTNGDLNGSRTLSSVGNKVHKTAEDYLRQIGSDDLKLTDDGLDIYCAKCEKLLSKVAMGQRVRIDNLFSHVNSWAHKKMGEAGEEPKESPKKKVKKVKAVKEEAPSTMANGDDDDDEHDEDHHMDHDDNGEVVNGDGGDGGDGEGGETPKTKSGRKKRGGRGSGGGARTKTAQEYVEQLQCPEIEVAMDGLNIQCLACDRLITKVDKGQRIRVDNITTHIRSTSHKALAEVRNAGELREPSAASEGSPSRIVETVQPAAPSDGDSEILANTGLVPNQGSSGRGSGGSGVKRSKRKMGIPAKSAETV